MSDANYRAWEYERLGDYHRNLDYNWSYTPTYLKKMKEVRKFIAVSPANATILDAGCGEGVLVQEYQAKGRLIQGLDLNYASDFVIHGDILSTPFEDSYFDIVLLLDVFEHLSYVDQPRALSEIKRILKPTGLLFLSIPNMAHLNARFSLAFYGRLDRTDIEANHPGERPMAENIGLLVAENFRIIRKKGITLTVPFVYRNLICKHAKRLRWLHDILDCLAFPSLAMVDIFVCQKES
jgi:SAM-dependent methyltransferase